MVNERPMGKMRLVEIEPHLPKKICGLLQSWRSMQIVQIVSGVPLKYHYLG